MRELVDGEKLKRNIGEAICLRQISDFGTFSKAIRQLVKDCTISPAELAAVLPNSRPVRQRSTGGQAGEIKSPEQIERAVKNLEESFKEMKTQNYPWGSYAERMIQINLLKWTLNQPQEEKGYPGSTWSDKELLDEEKIFGKANKERSL